jgi:hypothetical protein
VAKLISVHASSGNEGSGRTERTSERDPGLACSEQLDHPDDLDELVKDDERSNPGLEDAALEHELSHDGEVLSEGESLPAPEYSDLLDTAWLTRDLGAADWDEGVPDDVGVMLDLGDTADDDDGTTALEFDVGSLLTSLAPEATARETARSEREQLEASADESLDDAFAMRALHDLLLVESTFPRSVPESAHSESARPESLLPDSFSDSLFPAPLLPRQTAETDRGDDEVGDDERFPVFEPADNAAVSREDDAASDVELD